MFISIIAFLLMVRTVDLETEKFRKIHAATSKSPLNRFLDLLAQPRSLVNNLNVTSSSCYIDRSFEVSYRTLSFSFDETPCEQRSNLLNLFKPIIIFNISVIVFYDVYYERKGEPKLKIKHLFKGVQELFDSYDIINEIGIIKFYVVDMIRLDVCVEDVILTDHYSDILLRYLDFTEIQIDKRIIQIWLTNARIFDHKSKEAAILSRLEGLARTRSFCSKATLLVNCNSLAKSIITVAHEIAHILSANHDHDNSNCQNIDQTSFIMAKNYSPLRNSFSALSRSYMHTFLNEKLLNNPKCVGQVFEYKFTYEDVKNLQVPTLDEQCQEVASKKYKSVQPEMSNPNFCERLHCKHGMIEFSTFPVMNGTPCNKIHKMICCFGRCVVNCTASDYPVS